MAEKHTAEHLEAAPHSRRQSIEDILTTTGRRGSDTRDINYVDHREGDDRAEAAKGRDSAAFKENYWYSANFIGTLLAIGFSFMAGIGGEIQRIQPRSTSNQH